MFDVDHEQPAALLSLDRVCVMKWDVLKLCREIERSECFCWSIVAGYHSPDTTHCLHVALKADLTDKHTFERAWVRHRLCKHFMPARRLNKAHSTCSVSASCSWRSFSIVPAASCPPVQLFKWASLPLHNERHAGTTRRGAASDPLLKECLFCRGAHTTLCTTLYWYISL